MKIYQDNAGHMTKMVAMLIYGKHLKNLSRNHWADFYETLYKLQRPKLFIFCSNYDPLLALTYFMARSNFAS